jgi:HEPN domain-containing protein
LRDLFPDGWGVAEQFPELAWLGDWYIDSRYPEHLADATDAEAREAIETAGAVVDLIVAGLRERGYRA